VAVVAVAHKQSGSGMDTQRDKVAVGAKDASEQRGHFKWSDGSGTGSGMGTVVVAVAEWQSGSGSGGSGINSVAVAQIRNGIKWQWVQKMRQISAVILSGRKCHTRALQSLQSTLLTLAVAVSKTPQKPKKWVWHVHPPPPDVRKTRPCTILNK
jgi:hypothetical protein